MTNEALVSAVSDETAEDREVARFQAVRAKKQRATAIGVVAGLSIGTLLFFGVGYLAPDSFGLLTLVLAAALGAGVGVGLRFALGPREKELDTEVPAQPKTAPDAESERLWAEARRDGGAPVTRDASSVADDDAAVAAARAEYARGVRRQWGARIVSGVAGLFVAGAGIAFGTFVVTDAGIALRLFAGSIAAGTAVAVLLHMRLAKGPLDEDDAVRAPIGDAASFASAMASASQVTLAYEPDLFSLLGVRSRACRVTDRDGAEIARVREKGGWLARALGGDVSLEVLDVDTPMLFIERERGFFGVSWRVRSAKGGEELGRVSSGLFGGTRAEPKGGEAASFRKRWLGGTNIVRRDARGAMRLRRRSIFASALEATHVDIDLPPASGDALTDRAVLVAAAIVRG